MPLKICIISSFIAGFGKTGGFGNMTKQHALAMRERGCNVTVVVPRRRTQPRLSYERGIKIIGLDPAQFFSKALYRSIDADIYHSQNPNFLSFMAMVAEPQKKHVVTCRDPRDARDWLIELRLSTWKRRLISPFVFQFDYGPFVAYAIKKADLVGCPGFSIIEKVEEMYGRTDAILLPNFERFPKRRLHKSKKPTVCFIGRLDAIKRPEEVFALARKFSQVDFLIAGVAQDAERQKRLSSKALELPNIKMLGEIDKFSSDRLSQVYEKAWILLNTSPREGLPLTFIEAAGHGCAILSSVDPDEFATRFGYWARESDFEKGLNTLLVDNAWKPKGELAKKYVSEVYDEENSIRVHLQIYERLLSSSRGSNDAAKAVGLGVER
jgi:glycosyltransferase involved in cell wall biosynthesis